MLNDHFNFFGNAAFLRRFIPIVDTVLNYFYALIDPELGLVVYDIKLGL